MRKKEMKLIITFPATADAMAFERACGALKMPGRIIPVPRSISAGCGMAWCAPLGSEESLKRTIDQEKLVIEGIYQCLI